MTCGYVVKSNLHTGGVGAAGGATLAVCKVCMGMYVYAYVYVYALHVARW
jgi:hypothetical protein